MREINLDVKVTSRYGSLWFQGKRPIAVMAEQQDTVDVAGKLIALGTRIFSVALAGSSVFMGELAGQSDTDDDVGREDCTITISVLGPPKAGSYSPSELCQVSLAASVESSQVRDKEKLSGIGTAIIESISAAVCDVLIANGLILPPVPVVDGDTVGAISSLREAEARARREAGMIEALVMDCKHSEDRLDSARASLKEYIDRATANSACETAPGRE